MSNDADSDRKADLIAKARHQMAAVTSEFQRGLSAVKDPAQRRQLTSAYLDMVRKYLDRAQDSLASYRGGKHQPTTPPGTADSFPAGTAHPEQQPPVSEVHAD
jgi:23S rRNA A2030 N6-methylase RlmJ